MNIRLQFNPHALRLSDCIFIYILHISYIIYKDVEKKKNIMLSTQKMSIFAKDPCMVAGTAPNGKIGMRSGGLPHISPTPDF